MNARQDNGKRVVMRDGVIRYSPYMDIHDQPVERTPDSHPYSYDDYVLWRNGPNSDVTGGVYTDRLFQWDYDLTNSLLQKHTGKQSQYFDKIPKDVLQSFLRERLALPDLEIVYLVQSCNRASGYPLWYIAYKSNHNTEA